MSLKTSKLQLGEVLTEYPCDLQKKAEKDIKYIIVYSSYPNDIIS